MFQKLITRLLGMTGRSSRLDLDKDRVGEFETASGKGDALARGTVHGHLTIIEGGLSGTEKNSSPRNRPQSPHRRTG